MDTRSLTTALKTAARELGFSSVGVCPAATPQGWTVLQQWLERGFDGQMSYIRDRSAAYAHPQHVLDGVRSVVMLTLPYLAESPAEVEPGRGRVSRYAWNPTDYHDLIHERLRKLGNSLRTHRPAARVRGVVDTAPLLERDLAQQAGLGWIAKNTMLIQREQGSWFFLAALLTDQELEYDSPHRTDHCGTCRACLDACPTQAFPEPYVLDARRCISYLTIELRGSIPRELRPGIGDWVFGCDVCQDVCPWNRKAPLGDETDFAPAPGMNPLELIPLFQLSDQAFRQRFRHTALWRNRRRGLLRNAAIVLGNQRCGDAVQALAAGLEDEDAVIRGACAWALGRIGGNQARQLLAARLGVEPAAEVRDEIQTALDDLPAGSDP